ncbi:MAG: uroporphyrinogen decarboxylase family protein [Bryobacteraceae bacterium]
MGTPTTATTSRHIVLEALERRQPSRLPVDFGGTIVSGMHVSVVAALREHYSLERRPVKLLEPFQMLGLMEEDLKQALGIDTEGVVRRRTKFGYLNENWKPWRLNGLEVLVGNGFETSVDASGDTLIYPQGDRTAAPSGRMPKDGQFFDAIIRQNHFDENHLNPEDNCEEFTELSSDDVAAIAEDAKRARATGRAVVAAFGGMAFGDISNVPGPGLKDPRGIRDVAEWYVSTSSRREYIQAVFQRQCEVALKNLEKLGPAVGDMVDIVYVCGTDFGTQNSSFCSARTFRELWLPHYREICGWIHRNTKWKCFKHSCGSVRRFIDPFIEAGFDVLNPVQCSAAGMEAQSLKAEFGGRIAFWGGGVDTQHTLPFGTAAEVREQVLRRCEAFSAGGGFVFNAVHNVQAGTPVQNIVAMLEAVREFNGR